ncbi:class I SAM-dependent methyltransferase [Actinoplanes auranticolor]|uniref:NDP-hexose 3-C-methyltransferase n=1 Tax=Actinoplanes auranticolor TaxID=47988 RepID=A0A919SLP5_9ACTN|nr:class I SAM-dependent methyltransferase [Actinoplanes auranticolor]GIM74431.1 NDP-hexose 3-C-methyltransferase [Actinoplanes auranticolor]
MWIELNDNDVSGEPTACRVCGGPVRRCLDLGRQPVSNAFLLPEQIADEAFFRLEVGICTRCTLVQQLDVVAHERMFRPDYPYRSSTSARLRRHFADVARTLHTTELTGPDDLVVEVGSNDGIMLRTLSDAGVRHLGVDPCVGAGDTAAQGGVRIRIDYFNERSAAEIRRTDGPAKVIFSANTISHIADLGSVFGGVDALLTADGVFVFEDRYLADIIAHTTFDQIYDEHVYLLAVRSVSEVAAVFGFELIDAQRLGVHGGSMRYTVARAGARPRTARVDQLIGEERALGLGDPATFAGFGARLDVIGKDLVALLTELRSAGMRVAGYGATSKSATVTNYCGIGTDLVPVIYDTTPEKQGRLTPGAHIPVESAARFTDPYPDYALLFAWNHAEEIIEREREFRDRGGRWILYVPDVHLL